MAAVESGPARQPADAMRSGVLATLAANAGWGFLPLLFYLLDGINPVEVVAARTVFSLLVVGLLILGLGQIGDVRAALAHRRTAGTLLLSALLLAANWLIYVYAVQTGHVLEGSFGYFTNPMVNVAMGMLFLGERQRPWQSAALVLAFIAIGIQAIGLGRFPSISLGLALSFGIYGYLRKTVRANSTTGLAVETLLLTPLAIAYLLWSVATAGIGPLGDPKSILLLLATGPATAAPLLLYAYGVQRLRLTTVGMFQYIAPSIQFLLAITFFGEHLNVVRLASFVLVWVSLAIFSFDSVRPRRTAPA